MIITNVPAITISVFIAVNALRIVNAVVRKRKANKNCNIDCFKALDFSRALTYEWFLDKIMIV